MIATSAHKVASDGFRLRGTEMSRIDGFSDVVFGFALTLLVVSLEVPKSYTELHELMRGFLPFAINFSLLVTVWYAHYTFFRRYGLHDTGTIALNAMLLFVVLVGLTGWWFTRLPTGFLPTEDQGYAIAGIQLPDAASLERTRSAVKKVSAVLEKTPGVDGWFLIGGNSLLDGATASNAATFYLNLVKEEIS